MIKKIIAVIIIVCALGFPVMTCNGTQQEVDKIDPTQVTMIVCTTSIITDFRADNIYILKCNELLNKQKKLLSINDKKEWFISYKKLIVDYEEWCDPPETIYDYYNKTSKNKEELKLLFQVVEAETRDADFNSKCNVASVIFNRIDHNDFGNSLSEILIKSQFSCISNGIYKTIEVSDDTILACEYVWMIGDTTDGCLYFESGSNNIHSSYAEFQFEDDIGHKFYTERRNKK